MATTSSNYEVLDGPAFPSIHVKSFLIPSARFVEEIRMMKFVQAVVAKPEWYRKIHDSEIVAKWKRESMAQDPALREQVLDYAQKEIEALASLRDNDNGIEPSGVDSVWKSDNLISSELHQKFLAGVDGLEKSLVEKDYHPGSNNQVLNLVHPSLFCLVYGESTDNNGDVIDLPDSLKDGKDYLSDSTSKHYQWLPAEVRVDGDGVVKIASYINNLPADTGLYPVLADIFACTVPLFEKVLGNLRYFPKGDGMRRFQMPDDWNWWENGKPGTPSEVYENDNYNDEMAEKWRAGTKDLLQKLPVPEFKSTPMTISPEDAVNLRTHRLQVIVKLGSIVLDPANPDYPGGNWHVEGMVNEKIVATAIYYYDSENIAGDSLRFRAAVELDMMDFDQDDDIGAFETYGMRREDAMVQDAGEIKTPAGRVIVFPNIYQHSIAPFSLLDKSKPGHRKILVFFLVDPTQRITSTADVPPQNEAWINSDLEATTEQKLPREIFEMVQKGKGSVMTLEKAKEHRLKLMEERSYSTDSITQEIFEREFNLCEH